MTRMYQLLLLDDKIITYLFITSKINKTTILFGDDANYFETFDRWFNNSL
jgi:hypothetical protein